jgi:hypothetical protein
MRGGWSGRRQFLTNIAIQLRQNHFPSQFRSCWGARFGVRVFRRTGGSHCCLLLASGYMLHEDFVASQRAEEYRQLRFPKVSVAFLVYSSLIWQLLCTIYGSTMQKPNRFYKTKEICTYN